MVASLFLPLLASYYVEIILVLYIFCQIKFLFFIEHYSIIFRNTSFSGCVVLMLRPEIEKYLLFVSLFGN